MFVFSCVKRDYVFMCQTLMFGVTLTSARLCSLIGDVSRRSLLQALLGISLPLWKTEETAASADKAIQLGPEQPFSFENLCHEAAKASLTPFIPQSIPAPEVLDKLDYPALSKIQHRVDDALFLKGPGDYRATFFHLGTLFRTPVRISVVTGNRSREVLYESSLFESPADSPARDMPADSGFAGFRLHKPKDYSEGDGLGDFLAFLGASYFRSSGPLSQYGLSARGLAIDVAPASPRKVEEFPAFTRFWIEPQNTRAPLIYAWLDSPSAVGAFRFSTRLTPGETTIDVECALHLRSDIGRLGFAPLTSMYWFSERRKEPTADWRPEVHDSDGMAILTAEGKAIWRPLANPETVRVSSFKANGIRGFGLMQRDRNANHYSDPVHFERRPSLWIEPHGRWPDGSIELVEIPTEREYDDNIVAFFRPKEPAVKGNSYNFRYTMRWTAEDVHLGALAHCIATRMGRPIASHGKIQTVNRWIVVDWQGSALLDLNTLSAQINVSRGKVGSINLEPVTGQRGAARVRFDIDAAGKQPIEMTMILKRGQTAISETWAFVLEPYRGLIVSPPGSMMSADTGASAIE